jgi:hypothetical protein
MVKINSDGIFENPLGKSAPTVDRENPVSSVSDIRSIPVLNTIDAEQAPVRLGPRAARSYWGAANDS